MVENIGIEIKRLEKVYSTGDVNFRALKDVNIEIERGELTAIVGPSGCGKTTLLNMITGIDRPSRGSVTVNGLRIDRMRENRLSRWRGRNVGVVFQFFQLFPTLTALENVMLPMDLAGNGNPRPRRKRSNEKLEMVGLGEKGDRLPRELSGGEQQRVAIARALANDPEFIIGDEPTGNLDSVSEGRIFELFDMLNGQGKTIIYVTHSRDLARKARRRVKILDGRIIAS